MAPQYSREAHDDGHTTRTAVRQLHGDPRPPVFTEEPTDPGMRAGSHEHYRSEHARTPMRRKDEYRDGDLPKRVDRYVDLDDVPDDLIEMLATEYIVRAVCRNCGHEDYYVDSDLADEPTCKSPNCSEQLLLD